MAIKLKDFLSPVQADYPHALGIDTYKNVDIKGALDQEVERYDDGSSTTFSFNNDRPNLTARLPIHYLSSSDKETILDWYFDGDKANGRGRTFLWVYDSDTYVVRFDCDFELSDYMGLNSTMDLVLRIEGY